MTVQFLHGDSLAILPTLAEGSVDCVVTSPPYNLGIEYRSGFPDDMPRDHYLAWTRGWLAMVRHVLAPAGSLFLNVGGKPVDPYVPFQVLGVATEFFKLQNPLYWVKSLSEDGGPVEGHVKQIQSDRFVNDCVEHVFHLTKTGDVKIDRLAVGVPYASKENLTRGTRGKNGDVRCRGNAWVIPYPTITNRDKDRPHPASYPPALAEACYRLHGTSRIRLTLDPFSGLGSSGRAADALGLDHVGIELSGVDVDESYRLLEEDRARRLAEAAEAAVATAWDDLRQRFLSSLADPASFVPTGIPKQDACMLILAHLHRAAARGLTCDELEQALGAVHQSVSARVSELKAAGAARETGEKRETRTGARARVLVLSAGWGGAR